MASWLTGSVSVATGDDSVPTGQGVCAPFPGEMIKDGASFRTGLESVRTAGQPPTCNDDGPPVNLDMIYWYRGDAGVTKDVDDRISIWADQGPRGNDASAIDGTGAPTPTVNRPIWTAADNINGIPTADFGLFGATPDEVRWLQNIPAEAHQPLPVPDGAPRMVFALVKPRGPGAFDAIGGNVVTFRKTAEDLEFMVLDVAGENYVAGNLGDHVYILDDYESWNEQVICIRWVWDGAAMEVTVNGTLRAGFYNHGPLANDNGLAGFSIGYNNAYAYTARAFSGLIAETFAYEGVDSTVSAAAYAYLMQRAGLA